MHLRGQSRVWLSCSSLKPSFSLVPAVVLCTHFLQQPLQISSIHCYIGRHRLLRPPSPARAPFLQEQARGAVDPAPMWKALAKGVACEPCRLPRRDDPMSGSHPTRACHGFFPSRLPLPQQITGPDSTPDRTSRRRLLMALSAGGQQRQQALRRQAGTRADGKTRTNTGRGHSTFSPYETLESRRTRRALVPERTSNIPLPLERCRTGPMAGHMAHRGTGRTGKEGKTTGHKTLGDGRTPFCPWVRYLAAFFRLFPPAAVLSPQFSHGPSLRSSAQEYRRAFVPLAHHPE